METITFVIRRSPDLLQQRLERESASFSSLPYRCSWSDCGSAGTALTFVPEQYAGSGSRQSILEAIVPLVAQFMIEDLWIYMFRDLLRLHYCYFGRNEREEILDTALRQLKSSKLHRRRELHRGLAGKKIGEYLAGPHNHLNIEGFNNFRLVEWRRELRRLVEEAVESYLAEREHREFIRLLKYFLNLQLPKINLIHLFADKKGCVRITDHCFNQVDPCDWEEIDLQDFDEESDYEDILVSMLVSIAPRRIMLHRSAVLRYPRAAEILRSIFDKRLIYCESCSRCRREKAPLVTGDSNRRSLT